MSEFIPSKKSPTDFNNNQKLRAYTDVVKSDMLNNVVESQLYTQNIAETANTNADNAIRTAKHAEEQVKRIGTQVEVENIFQDKIHFDSDPQTQINNYWKKVYPIGSIYMTTTDTHPASLFGGSWKQLKDRFLLGAGDIYKNTDKNGSADAVVVKHRHEGINCADNTGSLKAHYNWGGGDAFALDKVGNNSSSTGFYTNYTGVDGKGKNMPPYLVVKMWERIPEVGG